VVVPAVCLLRRGQSVRLANYCRLTVSAVASPPTAAVAPAPVAAPAPAPAPATCTNARAAGAAPVV
jgi:hypothetical protein